MSNKPGMLPGDQFSFDEWKAAQSKPRSTPALMAAPITNALYLLEQACIAEGVPYLVALGLKDGDMQLSNLLDKPENVSHPLLLARSAVVENPGHKLALMAYSLQSLDLSKLQL